MQYSHLPNSWAQSKTTYNIQLELTFECYFIRLDLDWIVKMRITPLILNLVLILNTASCNPVPDYSTELVSIQFDHEDQNNEATLEWSDETKVLIFCFWNSIVLCETREMT